MNHKLESRLPGDVINNLRYADNTTLMAESEEELKRTSFFFFLKSLFMRMKRRVKKLP